MTQFDMLPDGYREYFQGESTGEQWVEVGEYVADRPEWRWEMPSSDSESGDFANGLWCYGLIGTCVLALRVSMEGQFLLYIARGDIDERYYSLDDLGVRLVELERENEGYSPFPMDLADEELPGLLEKWRREQGMGG